MCKRECFNGIFVKRELCEIGNDGVGKERVWLGNSVEHLKGILDVRGVRERSEEERSEMGMGSDDERLDLFELVCVERGLEEGDEAIFHSTGGIMGNIEPFLFVLLFFFFFCEWIV